MLTRRGWFVLGTLILLTGPSAGRQTQQGSDAPGGAAPPAAPAAQAPARHSLSQFVTRSGNRPVVGATIAVSGSGAGAVSRLATTDSTGRFVFDSLPAGPYTLQVMYPGASRPITKQIEVTGKSTGDIYLPSAPEPSIWWTVGCLLLYLVTIMLARWHSIARSLDEMLKGQLNALRTRIKTELGPGSTAEKAELEATIDRIESGFGIGSTWSGLSPLIEFLFWSRGRENAAWVAIHEVERELAAYLAPPERVASYLRLTDAQLRVINSPPAMALAEAIRASLAVAPDRSSTMAVEAERRALLAHGIALIYEERDKQFSTLMEWTNKASWLILAATIIIGFLALAAGNAVLFLAGAAGGFLSRVMRALRRDDLPLDYGASWTTLFLSPLFGALAAWFGVAIITMATLPNVNLLGNAFKAVDWDNPLGPVTLAAAVILGFSERLFDAIVGAVEKHAAGVKAAEEAAKAAGVAPAAAARAADRAVPAPPAAGAAGNGASAAGSLKLALLPDIPLPVQTVSGKVVLDRPAALDTTVTLTTSHADYAARPSTLVIPTARQEVGFEIVPSGHAAAGEVQVTARAGSAEASDVIVFE